MKEAALHRVLSEEGAKKKREEKAKRRREDQRTVSVKPIQIIEWLTPESTALLVVAFDIRRES